MKKSFFTSKWFLAAGIICVLSIQSIAIVKIAKRPEKTTFPSTYILSPQEFAIACPEWTPPEEVPYMWVVRYVKDGKLHEIPTYSIEERDGLIAYLEGYHDNP